MPKLLQINVVSNYLSTGTIIENISKIAQKRGWDTYVCYGRKALSGVNKEYRVGSFIESVCHYIENRLLDNEGLGSRWATNRLIRYIKRVSPDIVHLHNIHDHYVNYRILFDYLNRSHIPVVWTFHDFWAITGHCHHFINAPCELWMSGCHDCPLQHGTVNSLIDRSRRNYKLKRESFSSCKNLSIVPVSNWVGEMVKHSFLKDKHIEIIPNGIDLKQFQNIDRYDSLLPEDRFVILAVANGWSSGDMKGLDDYLKLSCLLKEDEIIVLVGMSKGMINRVPDKIVGIERIDDRQRLISLYSRADVLLSLSRAETFGLTVIEANACGTPAIVYDNTAQPSLITPSTGFVANDKDVEDVYNKVKIIKARGKAYYSTACKEHVKRYYDYNTNFNKYVDLYEHLMHTSQ